MISAPLKAVRFADLQRWDVKYFLSTLECRYPLVPLSELVTEHNEKIRPFDFPGETFKILGVNNTGGIFHAYDSLGKKIKQPYKKVSAGDFAYNPYRVNVGSIGIVPPEHDGAYISPAYVVFHPKSDRILPELLLFILKGDFFNETLRAATAGSVRMNLTYDLLRTLRVPLPPLDVQESVMEAIQDHRTCTEEITSAAKNESDSMAERLHVHLGLSLPSAPAQRNKLMVLRWKEVSRWSIDYLRRERSGCSGFAGGKFPVVSFQDVLTSTMNGYCIKPSSMSTDTKTLKLSAILPDGALDLDESKPVSVAQSIQDRYSLQKGDLLICRSVGSFEMVAKTALVTSDMHGYIFPDIMIRVRLRKTEVIPEYALAILNSARGRLYFQSNARTAVGMWKIGASDIKNFPMPLPSLTVQQELVSEITQSKLRISELNAEISRSTITFLREAKEMILGLRPQSGRFLASRQQ